MDKSTPVSIEEMVSSAAWKAIAEREIVVLQSTAVLYEQKVNEVICFDRQETCPYRYVL